MDIIQVEDDDEELLRKDAKRGGKPRLSHALWFRRCRRAKRPTTRLCPTWLRPRGRVPLLELVPILSSLRRLLCLWCQLLLFQRRLLRASKEAMIQAELMTHRMEEAYDARRFAYDAVTTPSKRMSE